MYTSKKPESAKEVQLPDETLKGMVKRRAAKSAAHWESKYNLKKTREQNLKLYDTSYLKDKLLDDRYEEFYADNRLFTAIRTIIPFITQRVAAPAVLPADSDDDSSYFARDFEKILELQADKVKARAKVKLAVEDLLKGQRLGVLKWMYNTSTRCLELKYVDPSTITLDHTAKLYEEPKFIQERYPRCVGTLISQFPDKKDLIYAAFNIQKGVPSQLELEKDITESWIWYDDGETSYYLVVFMLDELVLGAIKDPNWMNELENVNEFPMTPYIFFNMLNDGKKLIDNTSFIEQAQFSQNNYDKLGKRIVEDAAYGGIGVPVIAKGAMDENAAAKVQFNPTQRLVLDTEDVGKAFTTWQSGNMPSFIPNEKQDARNNVDNTFGTPNIFRGEQSNNNTATQDVLIRDQAEGRQSELLDMIMWAMDRFYQVEAMYVYRYFDQDKFYRYKGDDGVLVKLAISQKKIAKNIGIYVSADSDTGRPLDKSQQRATAIKLLELNKIGTLDAYKMLDVDDPEETFKRYILETADPKALLDEVDKKIYDREADEDIQMVIAGEQPEEREDIADKYLNHLNEYLLTDKFKLLKPDQQQAVSQFVQLVLDKASRKLAKLSAMQPPPPPQPVQQQLTPPEQQATPPAAPPQPQVAPTPEELAVPA